MAKNSKQLKGFSVIELMIVLSVAALLIATAVPSFTATIQNNRLVTQVNELHAGLSLARSEAVKRNRSVTVCRSSNGASCAGSWEDGWIVFVDTDFDGAVDGGEEVLNVKQAVPGNITVDFSATQVIYAGNGIARAGSNGVFTLCDSRGDEAVRGLVISPSGRPRLAMDSDDDGIVEDASNNNLSCSS
jgi:type IV fimbrial biogenesis protein FimT